MQTVEQEADRLHRNLADADESMAELEDEVDALVENRARMRVEIHDAHCQVRCVYVCVCLRESRRKRAFDHTISLVVSREMVGVCTVGGRFEKNNILGGGGKNRHTVKLGVPQGP